MSRPWMPLYVGDYLGDTRRLNTLQHGAYMLLIMEYWQQGGLPDDDDELAHIAGLSQEQWQGMRSKIAALFLPGWRHKRIDAEIEKAEAKSNKAKESAGKRWQSDRSPNAMPTQCERISEGNANAHANAMLPQPQLQSEKKDISARKRASIEFEKEFDDVFWPEYPHKVDKPDSKKAFVKARAGTELTPIMTGLRSYKAGKPEWQAWKSPAAWLRGQKWLDQPAPPSGLNVLPFGNADPPRRQLTEAEQAERARKFNEDYAAGRIS